MTGKQWSESHDSCKMLDALRGRTVSNRKLRLFAAACCRRYWPALVDRGCRKAVEVVEYFADGQATRKQLRQAHRDASAFSESLKPAMTDRFCAAFAATHAAYTHGGCLAKHAAYAAAVSAAYASTSAFSNAVE